MAQTIAIKQVGCTPGSHPCPDPVYPLSVGATFYVAAIADSGLPVTQRVISGSVTPLGGRETQSYRVTGPETIVIRATQAGDTEYAPAIPVELILAVAAGNEPASACDPLGPPGASQTEPQIDLPGIIGLIGNPTPFVLTAQGNRSIFIYSTRFPLHPEEYDILATIPSRIAALAGQTAASLGVAADKPFKVELSIPHAAALGDLAPRIAGLNYSQFTVQDIGGDRVRISALSQPECSTWKEFLAAIRRMEWQVTPEPFDMKLYYLSSTDAATAFTSLAGGASASAAPAAASGAGGGAKAGSPAGGSATTTTAAAGTATVAANQPAASASEVTSDTASGTGAAAATSPSGAAAASAAPPKPPAMAAMQVAAGTGEQNPSDLLVFSDATPGDDAQILERKRILAQLDLPRPEMLINAWVMQNSSANPRAMGTFSNVVRDLVAGYNDALEQVVNRGWTFVSSETRKSGYFDPDYYAYIAGRYIADNSSASAPASAQEASQAVLSNSPAKLADRPDDLATQFGVCPNGRYCLGYNILSPPLKPRLTDLLLTLTAAKDPVSATTQTIDFVQGPEQPAEKETACDAQSVGRGELRDRCRAIWNSLGLDSESPSSRPTCATNDYKNILGALLNTTPDLRERPRIYLNCFKDAAKAYLPNKGLLRSAIADFLFNYKVSQQYPHEFMPYDLSQSADTLNSALSPLIDAFNRDIVAFQTFMRADIQYHVARLNNASDQRCCVKRLFGLDKPSFFNDGIVSVRTISGQPTSVGTTSQSFLNASTAPTLSSLVNGIASPGGSAGASPLAALLGTSQSSAALLAGVLNAYQTTNVQIGRSLQLQVVPRSLSTASSAEIAVTLNTDETSGGPVYSGGPPNGTAPNTSRVAQHDITTRIRVESVKLFEVSSFSAIVQRSRSRFPLLPPFVEIPYIGTVAGIPVPGAKEYHSSIAVMSAMVVPTAADIAYGLRFVFDQVVDGPAGSCSYVKGSAGPGVANPCQFRRAVSLRDLNNLPIVNYHKAIIHCFATDMKSPYSSPASLTGTDTGACENLNFDRVPRSAF